MMFLRTTTTGIIIDIYAQPGSRNTVIAGLHDSRLKIKVSARAVEGAANEALCAFISECLQTPKSSITLILGEKSRKKSISVLGDSQKLSEKLKSLLPDAQDF